MDYAPALALQKSLVEARAKQDIGDTVLFVEHPATITLGRSAGRSAADGSTDGSAGRPVDQATRNGPDVVAEPSVLSQLGITVHDVGRGGQATYHGPGQLVVYPIIDLKPDRQDVRKYVWTLEETMIRTAADFGVRARRVDGLRGIWVEGGDRVENGRGLRKLGAVGVRISRWITMHGFALNNTTNLRHFDLIVPCGIRDHGVTSLEQEIASPPSMEDLAQRAAAHLASLFDAQFSWHSAE